LVDNYLITVLWTLYGRIVVIPSYGKAHNAQGRAALQGEAGEKLKAMREAGAKLRSHHLRSPQGFDMRHERA